MYYFIQFRIYSYLVIINKFYLIINKFYLIMFWEAQLLRSSTTPNIATHNK